MMVLALFDVRFVTQVRDYLDFLHGVEEKDVTENYQINQHGFDDMISHLPGATLCAEPTHTV